MTSFFKRSITAEEIKNWNSCLLILLVATTDFISGKLGLLLAIPPEYATVLWPPSGIALAAVLLFGPKVLPGVWLGSFALNIEIVGNFEPLHLLKILLLPSAIALGSTLQTIVTTYALKKLCNYPQTFERGEKIFRFLILSAPLSCTTAPTFGVLCLYLAGRVTPEQLPLNWAVWWAGDTIGVLVFTPVLLVMLAPPHISKEIKNIIAQKTGSVAVFLLSMAFTIWYWGIVAEDIKKKGEIQFTALTNEITTAVHRRMKVYQQVLYGCRGLYSASQSVERNEWRNYIQQLEIEENYPGIQALGFIAYVTSNQKVAHIENVRANGFPDYTIKPPGERPDYGPITYVEPFTGRNLQLLGHDIWAEPIRHSAMEQAWNTNKSFLSRKLTLIQNFPGEQGNGLLLFLPIYQNGKPHKKVEERKQFLIGWVYAAFRVETLINNVLKTLNDLGENIHLEILDGEDPKTLEQLYTSKEPLNLINPKHKALYRDQKQIKIAGRTWTLRFKSNPSFEDTLNYSETHLILLTGTLMSLLFSGLILNLFTTHVRAQTMADAMIQELHESRQRYDITVRGANDGIWDWNILTNEAYLSPQWKNMLGYQENELENNIETWKKLLHPEDVERALETVKKYLEDQGLIFELTFRMRHKDGSYHWILSRGIALRDKNGKPYRMAGSHTDITQQKKTDEDLRQANIAIHEKGALLSSVIHHMPVALFVKNVKDDYRFTIWNDACELIFGLNSEEVIGKNDYDFFPKEQADWFRKMDEQVMNQKSAIDTPEEPVDSKNLGKIILHTIKAPLWDAHGNPQYILGISENITERKRIDQMKSEFISTVSHELRTPLTSILGSLGLIIGGVAGIIEPQTKELLEIAKNNCERLVRLINDILDIEKIESNKINLKLEIYDLMTLIQNSIEANQSYATQLNVQLQLRESIAKAYVKVDSDRFAQVMANLLSNACKFSPMGGCVEVSVERRGESLRIAVTDHGPGIPKEFLGRIFQKFSQADSSDKRQKGGTGLGLSIAKALVEKFEGTMDFETEKNKGTTFFFDLPEVFVQYPNENSRPS